MKLLAFLGYMLLAIAAVVCGNILYSILSVKVAEKMGLTTQGD